MTANPDPAYRLVNAEPWVEPTTAWNPDDLFDADLHCQCAEKATMRAPLWFLCGRGIYVIEAVA